MTTDQIIGEQVHQAMWRQRITQTNLGVTLGMSQTAISKKLRGERPWFASELLKVADALSVSVLDLYGVIEPRNGPESDPKVNSGWSTSGVVISLDAARRVREDHETRPAGNVA